jgi:anti-sigma-K factor RskA
MNQQQLARALAEWQRRFAAYPEAFQDAPVDPETFGNDGAAFLFEIHSQQEAQ